MIYTVQSLPFHFNLWENRQLKEIAAPSDMSSLPGFVFIARYGPLGHEILIRIFSSFVRKSAGDLKERPNAMAYMCLEVKGR